MTRESRRVTVWLPKPVFELLQGRAAEAHLGMATELRAALLRGLKSESALPELAEINKRLDQLDVIAVAGVIATEQIIRFMVRHYPEGERRMLEVAEAACEKAEQRLAEVSERLTQAGAFG